MPATPVTWLDQFIANLTTTGSQSAPRITQLANGNLLVVWNSDDNTGVGADAGIDVIGQIFTPLGDLVGAEFRVNGGFFNDDERDADVAALSGGGFLTVFEDNDNINQNFSIRLTERDATGGNPVAVDIFNDASNNAAPSYSAPRIAVSSDTSALVVAVEAEVGGGRRIVGAIYDSVTNTVGSLLSLINVPGSNIEAAVSVVGSNYVIACVTQTLGGDHVISTRIVDASGGNVLSVTTLAATIGGAETMNDTTITALTGGGFVVGWTSAAPSTFIPTAQFQRFDAAGVVQGGIVTIQNSAFSEFKTIGDIVALSDGGFIVLYQESDSTQDVGLHAQRFDAAGVRVGVDFLIEGGDAISGINAVLLGDGRVAITYQAQNGEIGVEIIDPRDTVNDPGVYDGNQWQIGTVGKDVFTADGVSEFVVGHGGNDTITGAGQERTYLLGAGNDRMIVKSGIIDDVYKGGAGIGDTIDWTGSGQTGGQFDLGLGQATDGINTETMTGFENLTGTNGNDTILGNNGANRLLGGNGNDVIDGLGGIDFMNGGGGNDTIIVRDVETTTGGAGIDALDLTSFGIDISFDLASGSSNAAGQHTLYENVNMGGGNDAVTGTGGGNIIDGGGGADELHGLGGNDTITGGEGADSLFGDGGDDTLGGGLEADTIDGGAGNDTIRIGLGDFLDVVIGGADTDTLDMSGYTTDGFFLNAVTGQYGSSSASSPQTFTGIEVVIGTASSDTFIALDHTIIFQGGAGNDSLDLSALAGNTTFDMATGTTQLATALFTGFESVQMGGGGDTVTGTAGADTIDGGGGNDTLSGGNAGVDVIRGGEGNDLMIATNSGSSFNGGIGNDTFIAGDHSNFVNGGAGRDTLDLTGYAFDNSLDMVTGATGFSENYSGFEIVLMGAGNDSVSGTNNNDTIFGGGGKDSLSGGNKNDSLSGGTGNDTLTGGLGIDSFVFDSTPGAGNVDRISDFSVVDDTIRLDDAIFAGLATGKLALNAFAANANGIAVLATDRIIYETDTGRLFFDSDGTGNTARVQFAVIAPALAMTNLDFVVF